MRPTILAALLLALPAYAQDAPKDGREAAIAERDADGDGRLSAAEFGGGERLFGLLDRNGDGYLTAEELPEGRPGRRRDRRGDDARPGGDAARDPEQVKEMAQRIFQRLDKNGDGRLEGEEMPAGGRLDLKGADQNGDGAVDLFELTLALSARGAPRPEGAQEGMDEQRLREILRQDANGDGFLDKAEWKGPEPMFARLDADGDGRVSKQELKQAARAMQGGRAGAGPDLARRLKEMDGNGDGFLDKTEWKGSEQAFARIDADGDGRLSTEELQKVAKAAGDRWQGRFAETFFRRLDADGDGRVSKDEWKQRPELFQRLDADGDGFLTREEVTPQAPNDRRAGRRGLELDLRSGKDSAHFLAKFDKNGDGSVSKDEFPHERRFAEIDADGDGMLSADEIGDALDRRRTEEGFGFMERFDLDRDGKITREEFTGPAALFEKLDKNHDGVIDAADQPEKKK